MKEAISRYFQMGTLTWMSFPSLSTLEAVKRVAADEYFTAVEVRSCRDDAEREEVRRVLEQAHLTVYYGAHPEFPIVKDITPQTHAYITSRTSNFGGIPMKKLISCEFNIDTACVELKYSNGSMISINCTAVEDEVANNRFQRSELDWLIYNNPLSYAELILNGDPEEYLRTVTEAPQLDFD